MAIIQGSAKQGSTRGFYPKVINGSLRFNSGDAPYLSYTNGTATNGKKCTLSFWIKKNEIAGSPLDPSPRFMFAYSGTGNQFHSQWGDGASGSGDQWVISPGEQSSQQGIRMTDAALRDPSAWYHCVWKYNSESGSEESTLYINGVQQSSSVYTTAPTTDLVTSLTKSGTEVKIGYINSSMPDFQLADMYVIDGQALIADDFGETKNGVWVAKDYAGTFGTNGFYLTFEDDTEVEAFNTVLWRGNASTQSITGVGFSPDLVWGKERTSTSNQTFIDTVRGPNRAIFSNNTSAEVYNSNYLPSFDSDGFTLGNDGTLNQSGQSNVAWCWDAGANNAVTGHSSVTYTGNGGTQNISGFPFSPDLVWIKERSSTSSNVLFDTVRGVTNGLFSDSTSAESSTSTQLQVFDKYGFRTGSSGGTNESGQTYVAWAWDAGDGDPVSNTAGSITSTVKASQANGFSIVSWQATNAAGTLGHGLSQAPNFILVKDRQGTTNWTVYHSSLGSTKALLLNTTDSQQTNTNYWNDTDPTSTTFSVNFYSNYLSDNHIAYCFHDVTGKQKFGTYTGTGASGNSVTTGFRPGWVMIKRTDIAEEWVVYDSSRSPFNPNQLTLNPNRSDAEGSYSHLQVQFDSNGFTLLSTDSWLNASGGTYIYAAFAGSYSDYITDYNTDGSIDSRAKANDTTGFSIVSYTGDANASKTIGHGLSTAPDMIIVKGRNVAQNWVVYHSANTGSPETQRLYLDGTNATDTVAWWNNTAPTSSVFSVSNFGGTGGAYNYIAYCWAEKTGYSKFGSYTGNSSTSGPTVTCGFKPSFVLIKNTTNYSWHIFDGTRNTSAPQDSSLKADTSGAEYTNSDVSVTFSDTGFQITGTDLAINESGSEHIYAAFADTREAAFWLDQSGNDNDWQPVNLDHNDTLLDSPTNNFATMNPLQVATSGAPTFSDGNLQVSTPVSGAGNAVSTIGVTSGKYYAEVTVKSLSTLNRAIVGITGDAGATITANTNIGSLTSGLDVGYFYNGTSFTNNTETSGYGASYGVGDVIGIALNVDDSQVTFYKNGVSQGAISFNSGGTYHFAVGDGSAGGGNTFECNFGQQPFKYDPPA